MSFEFSQSTYDWTEVSRNVKYSTSAGERILEIMQPAISALPPNAWLATQSKSLGNSVNGPFVGTGVDLALIEDELLGFVGQFGFSRAELRVNRIARHNHPEFRDTAYTKSGLHHELGTKYVGLWASILNSEIESLPPSQIPDGALIVVDQGNPNRLTGPMHDAPVNTHDYEVTRGFAQLL